MHHLITWLSGGALAITASLAMAESGDAAAWSFKLTPSYYSTSHERDAQDINLRANQGPHAVWLGYYQRGSEFEQTRTGYELTLDSPLGKLVPSFQAATHGFLGGAVNLQFGDPLYGILGFGRTNLRDYYNLNFDPNDSLVYGMGAHLRGEDDLTVLTVKDNRLHTGQMVTHMIWRYHPWAGQRLTVDFASKHGRASINEESVTGRSLALTYDYAAYFIRVAQDRKVNFSREDQTRLALGFRFY